MTRSTFRSSRWQGPRQAWPQHRGFQASPRLPASTYVITTAFLLSVAGYLTFAPLFQLLTPGSALSSILLRAGVLLLCVAILMYRHPSNSRTLLLITPLLVFLVLYTIRLSDNIILLGLEWKVQPTIAYSMLIGGGLIPALVLSQSVHLIDERALVRLQWLFCCGFLLFLALNWDAIQAAAEFRRASLEKLNAISFAWITTYYAIFFAILRTRTLSATAARFALVLVLLGLAAYSQGRGPVIGTGFALVVYGLCIRGKHRRYLVYALIASTIGFAALPSVLGINLIDIALERFLFDSIDQDASAQGRLMAWRASWAQFLQNPLFGNIVYEPVLQRYPHNLFLESLISLGILGTTVLGIHLLISVRSVLQLLRSEQNTLLHRFVGILFFKELIQVQLSGAIWSNTAFWILSASAIGLAVQHRYATRQGWTASRRTATRQPGSAARPFLKPNV